MVVAFGQADPLNLRTIPSPEAGFVRKFVKGSGPTCLNPIHEAKRTG